MKTNTKTMKLGTADYAKVVDRLKIFREENPRGDIKTKPTIMPDGQIMFEVYILKDKSDETSGSATGHALGKNTGLKAFEKLETVATGRALALLGYMASGEIASSEEMDLFYEFKAEKKEEALKKLEECKNKEELRDVFMSLGSLMADKEIINKKDELKSKLK